MNDAKILVVDDNVGTVTAWVKFLEVKGFAAKGATYGEEAVATAAAWRPTVVLLDLGLPDIDGFEVRERIARDSPEPIAFVAISGRSDERTEARVNQAGFVRSLVKPVALDHVLSLLADLEKDRAVQARDSTGSEPSPTHAVGSAPVELNRDEFMRTLIRELAGTLTDVVGLDEAAGFVSIVGSRMGAQINAEYCKALDADRLNAEQVGAVLVDLKRRIEGDFYIIEQTDKRIVLGNRECPFAEKVLGRPALCMMTSNVFGSIAAANLGYAKVELQETIAQGASGCRIAVHLEPGPESEEAEGREYFKPNPD